MFKYQQVLTTIGEHTSTNGKNIPDGTRVIVMDQKQSGEVVRVKVVDIGLSECYKERVVIPVGNLMPRKRGPNSSKT